MKKISVITLFAVFTFAMPMMASEQRQEVEHHHRKEIRGKFRPKAMHHKDFTMMCEVVDVPLSLTRRLESSKWLALAVSSIASSAQNSSR